MLFWSVENIKGWELKINFIANQLTDFQMMETLVFKRIVFNFFHVPYILLAHAFYYFC